MALYSSGKEVKRIVHRWGIKLVQYLDDWLIQAESEELCAQHTQRVLLLCAELGLVVNHQKSELTPSRQFLFLGYMFDMIKYQCSPPQKRMDKFMVIIQHILRGQGALARQWQVLLGLLASSEKAVPLGRLHMREIMFCLYEQWDFNPTTSHRFIHLCPRARKDLCWWTLPRNVFRGCLIVPREPTIHFLTDASFKGWEAHWGSHNISGLWSPEEREDDINILELEVVSRALDMWLLRWAGQDVLVELDNSTAVAYLNKQGGTRSRRLSRLTTLILLRCDDHGMTLRARHIPGVRNVIADALSRREEIAQGEWSINRQVFLHLCNLWGTPTVELFATRYNFCLPLYVSGPRRKSHGGRRDVPELEGNVGICLSSTGASTTRSAEDSTTSLRGHPHSSSMARSSVVRSSTATPGRLPSASSSSYRSLDTGSTAPPRPFKPEASPPTIGLFRTIGRASGSSTKRVYLAHL